MVLSIVGFVLVPDKIVTYLSEHARTSVRDLATLTWVLVWFLAMSWLVTRLQRRKA
jgi:flagellar biogenesis protein FliO